MIDINNFESRLVRVSAITVERNASLLASRNPDDVEAVLQLGELLGVLADAGELILEMKRLRGLLGEAAANPTI